MKDISKRCPSNNTTRSSSIEKEEAVVRKRITNMLLLFLLAVVMLLLGITGSASASYASTNGHTQAEAVAWANQKYADNWGEDLDGNDLWCVDLIHAYRDYLGVPRCSGDACTYQYDDHIPYDYGWSREETPQPGDIVVIGANGMYNTKGYRTGTHGHIGIVTEVNGDTFVYISTAANQTAYPEECYVSYAACFVHPDFEVVPISAEFVPAEGFQARGFIGWNELYMTSNLHKVGNQIIVSFSDGSRRTFICKENDDPYIWGYDSSEEDDALSIIEKPSPSTWLKKGHNSVTYSFTIYDKDTDTAYDPVNMVVDVLAKKYYAYVVNAMYTYTGKKITVKPTVKNSAGQKVPKSTYTISYKKHSAMREGYEITVKFKNTKLYPKSIKGYYTIGPKRPEIKKITAGKNSAVVHFKKISPKHLKNISRIAIIYDTDKEWIDSNEFDYEDLVFVKKNKTSIRFKHLKKGQTYYFKACSWSKNGTVSFWSKTMKVKVK